MQKVRANIHLGNIRYNANLFATLTKRKICAVVKANAYGHGAEEVVNALEGIVDFFAVALIEEGLTIQTSACGKEILVFTPPTDEEELYTLSASGLVASVGELASAKWIAAFCNRYRIPLKVHLKINTGMNRYGMKVDDVAVVCEVLQACPYVKVCGIYTHLCECSLERAKKQKGIFEQALRVCKRYFPNVVSHLGGTYAALIGEDFLFDAVRIGLGLYGYTPCDSELALRRAMTVYAKTVAKTPFRYGGVGYGAECGFDGEDVSVLRFGYADGFLRKQHNGVDGWQTHANRLCMDVCLRKESGSLGEWQCILSNADETARLTDTIAYEVLCAATRRAEMIYTI